MRTRFLTVALGMLLGAQVAGAQTPARLSGPVFTEAPGLLGGQRLTQTQQYYTGYKVLHLDVAALRTQLAGAPLEFTGGTPKLLTLPLPQGGTATFRVYDSPVLAPNIAAQNPGIKTYSLQATSGPATGRLSFIDGVLNVVLFQADGEREVYFQHLDGAADAYLSYSTGQVKVLPKSGPNAQKNMCGTVSNGSAKSIKSLLASVPRHNGLGQRTGAVLRTYRLAVSATKEFTNGKANGTQAGGLAAVVTMVNVAKGVYRRELSVDFTLVSGTNTICTNSYSPAAFAVDAKGSNSDHNAMLGQDQIFVDAQVGNGNYDIGHVLGFFTGGGSGGGVASKSSLCRSSDKAQGVSAVNQPTSTFPQVYQDQVFAHEMGHQFSMDHSFNSSVPVCTTREAAYSVEPGAGTTIMSYGYTCDNNDPAVGLVGNDNYVAAGTATGGLPFLNFHAANIAQAVDYITNTATCNTNTTTNNALPTISTVSTGFTIPKSTPFTLTGAASGGAGTLSYSWEGMDVGATSQTGTVSPSELDDASKAPFFRSYAPMSTATRTFPLLSSILDGTNQAKGDKLPSVGRTLSLRLTTRDGVGGVDEMNSSLTVDGNSGPFLITSNLAGTYASGSTQAVTWSVNNTNLAPVSCTNVAILLSTDGGQTFGTTLLASTANDGTESVTLPYLGTATSQARLKVQAVGNIFFDISNSNFSINAGQAPVLTLSTGTVSGSSFCAGSAISVPFTASQAPNAGNVYTAQLSDASGSFASPVSLGTLSSVATSGTISGTIAAGTIQGSGYRVRVVGSDPATTGTDNGTNLTINNTPAPTGTASQSFSSGATVASLAATGTAVQWYAANTGGTALAGTTALVNGTTYYATQTLNGCESLSRLAVTVTVSAPTAPDLTVSTGSSATPTPVAAGTYNSITVTGTGYAQLSGAVVVNSTVAVQDGGTLSTNCQALTGAASFTLATGGTLVICDASGITASGATGAVQTTGTRSFSNDANYVYNGTAAQTTGNGLPSQVRNLTSTNSNTVTLSQALAIRQVLTLNAGSLALNSQALTLLSDASGTALVANLGTGTISGSTVTVQRYIDPTLNAGLGYRHLAAPTSGQTVSSFGSGGTAPVVNSAYNSAANPAAVTPFPTIFSYDQSRLATSPATTLSTFDKGWVSPASLTVAANIAFTGFTVQLPGASTLSFTGAVVGSGGIILLSRASGATAADAGLSLIGNPYPSPLDFNSITASQRTNVDAAFYVFESSSQYGGTYRSYVNGVGTSSLIGTAQAFFVRVTSGQTSGSLALNNSNRITTYGQQAPVRRTAASQRPLVQLALKGNSLTDVFYAYAEAGATAAFDSEYDAGKLFNSNGLNVSTTRGAVEPLSIDGRAAFTAATSFPLTVGVPAAGTYTFTAAALDNLPAGLTAYIYDAATGSSTALSAGSVYSFQITAAQAAAPIAGRFTLQFSPNAPLAAAPAALAAQVSVFPNPAHEQVTVGMPGIAGASTVQAELLNSLGQVVRHHEATLPAAGTAFVLSTDGLAAGVYVLRLTAGATFVTKRLTVQ